MHPALERELARLGRAWGALNDTWLATPRDYSHGSPAFKWSGADPVGADSARSRAMQFGSNTMILVPLRDRTKEGPVLIPETPGEIE
jgi:hypothetical protein